MQRKELEVIFTMGLPGCGKTTWALEYIYKNPNTVRVSRDDFRFMLRNQPVCEPKVEDMINGLATKAILSALKFKMNVVIDNCNLKARYMNEIIKLVQYKARVKFMLFDVPAKKCIERDAGRPKHDQVGEAAITKMNADFLIIRDSWDFSERPRLQEWMKPNKVITINHELPNAVLFDIDGTLALMKNRGPYDWEKVDRDSDNFLVVEQAKFHKAAGRTIILVSGRDEVCRELTEEWLAFYGIPYDVLLMRKKDDIRKDSIVKKEIYLEHIEPYYNTLCVYDDRLQVIAMWDKLGIFTFNVNQGHDDF